MPRQHGPRRARITFSDSAAKQLENITSEAEIHALDRALVVISVDPDSRRADPRQRQQTPAARVRRRSRTRTPPVLGDGLKDRRRGRLPRGLTRDVLDQADLSARPSVGEGSGLSLGEGSLAYKEDLELTDPMTSALFLTRRRRSTGSMAGQTLPPSSPPAALHPCTLTSGRCTGGSARAYPALHPIGR